MVANKVYADALRITKKYKNFIPTVEGIQDTVEKELILSEYVKTAKAYILYREKRSNLASPRYAGTGKSQKIGRRQQEIFQKFPWENSSTTAPIPAGSNEEGRRETWIETVDRYISFMKENLGNKLKETEYEELREGILKHEAMPSMRLLQFAGAAARKTNVCAYNCSYIAPEYFQRFG